MALDDLRGRRVGLLQSGGLSALAVGGWLADRGVDVLQLVADIGQDPPEAVRALGAGLERCGLPAVVVDLRGQMAATAGELVRYAARYEGGYWNTTGAARWVLVAGLVGSLRAAGCEVLAHGCVGGGNDHRRFARYAATLAPGLAVLAPWTEPEALAAFPDRATMLRYVTDRGLPLDRDSDADRSTDANLAGVSYETAALEDLRTSSRDAVRLRGARWPEQAPDTPTALRVRFERGRPVELDGRTVGSAAAVELANALAGPHGIGLADIVEDRINGTKCRGVYSAPGVELLSCCQTALAAATLDERALGLHATLAAFLGRQVYEGRYAERASAAARTAADLLCARVTGTVDVELYKGTVGLRGLDDVPTGRDTVRQTRLRAGGNVWRTGSDDVAVAAAGVR